MCTHIITKYARTPGIHGRGSFIKSCQLYWLRVDSNKSSMTLLVLFFQFLHVGSLPLLDPSHSLGLGQLDTVPPAHTTQSHHLCQNKAAWNFSHPLWEKSAPLLHSYAKLQQAKEDCHITPDSENRQCIKLKCTQCITFTCHDMGAPIHFAKAVCKISLHDTDCKITMTASQCPSHTWLSLPQDTVLGFSQIYTLSIPPVFFVCGCLSFSPRGLVKWQNSWGRT